MAGRELAIFGNYANGLIVAGVQAVTEFVEDYVTPAFKAAWEWVLGWFRKENLPNMYVEGDPNLFDEVSYKQSVIRTSRSTYYVSHRLKHPSQTITAISVLPLRQNLPSPEVEVDSGGINYRDVKLKLDPVNDGQWGCEIKICGSKPE